MTHLDIKIMLESFETNHNQATRQNLKWLLLLRVFVVAGECIIVVAAVYVVNYPIPKDPLWTLISLSVIVTSITWYRLHLDSAVSEQELFLHLIFDVVSITGLLYFTGGGTNPMIWSFLLPLIITATILPQLYTWLMVGITSAFYMLLIGYHVPLPKLPTPKHTNNIPVDILKMQSNYDLNLHVFALWFGYLVIAGAVAYFVVEMTNTLRARERKLSEVREKALRDERVVSLGTLAAGAAHEMGTPLGTMAIVTHELQAEYSDSDYHDLNGKLAIIRDQIDRCKDALSVHSASAGELRADSGRIMEVEIYLQEVISQWQHQQPDVILEFSTKGDDRTPKILAERTLSHALINILNNAGDVSPQKIELHAYWVESTLNLEIRDYGPGLQPQIAASFGDIPQSTKEHGLGVGLFLAKATISRLGGTIKIVNLKDTGTSIRIQLPLIQTTNGDETYN